MSYNGHKQIFHGHTVHKTRGGMKMKKALALLLTLALGLSIAGCSGEPEQSTGPYASHPPLISNRGDYSVDYPSGTVVAGSWELVRRTESDGAVTYNHTYPGGNGKDYTDKNFYTFRDYIASTGGLKWAPHTWETKSDSYILNFTTTGFYSFVPNEELTGFTIVDEMAQGAPRDVTASYAGQFGIAAGETGKAWYIALNPNACWADGTPINADTYLYSYRELLDGKMMNRRADSLYAGNFAIVGAKAYLYGEADWSEVGILKSGEYGLVFITTAPIADPEFYVPYNLTSTYLVYEPLWEQCKTYFDKDGNKVSADSENIASVTTNYSTSLATSMSYGPYKLTYFEPDKQITLQRNSFWHGYSDGKHLGQYQADEISCQVIANGSTALLAFLKGDLDTVNLSSGDIDRYAASDHIRFIPQTYTTKLTFNTDAEALSQRGSQILSNPNFRRGFSLAIDRSRFSASYTSAGVPGYGLLNEMYIYDPYTNASYRSSDPAKNALVQLYGLTFGSKGDYNTLSDAYTAITGYDLELAQQYMQLAYDEAVASGLYDGKSKITLQLSVYQSEDTYVQMYHFLDAALRSACLNTGFEGKVSLKMVVDGDYYATMESGLTDMIFSTWGGSAYEPYSLMFNCYCDAGVREHPNQMEYGFDADSVSLTITLGKKDYTASLQAWARWCIGDEDATISAPDGTSLDDFRTYDAYTRCAVYADMEFAYLSQVVTTPLYYRNDATLLSQKGHYPTKTYLNLVEFGGIAFYTFDYSDSEWEKVKGSLQY